MNAKSLLTADMAFGPNTALTEPERAVSVTRASSQVATAGLPEYFTGSVKVQSRFQANSPARVGGGLVSFEPSARTAWTHPLGQMLIVTGGAGLVQHWKGNVQEIGPSDVVSIPPGVKQWHGATSERGMSHIAITESLDGKTVDWMEHIGDEQYGHNSGDVGE